MGARCRAVEELDQVGRRATFRQQLKEGLEYPAAAEPPEPLPYAVPFAKLAGECAPGYAVYSEVVDGFQEFTIIVPRLSPARLCCIEHFQHDRPIALRHSCQHVRLPYAGHAVIRTNPDSRIRQNCMAGIPSTRPRRTPGFDIILGISTRHQRFACARLSGSHLTGSCPAFCCNAHHHRF